MSVLYSLFLLAHLAKVPIIISLSRLKGASPLAPFYVTLLLYFWHEDLDSEAAYGKAGENPDQICSWVVLALSQEEHAANHPRDHNAGHVDGHDLKLLVIHHRKVQRMHLRNASEWHKNDEHGECEQVFTSLSCSKELTGELQAYDRGTRL